MLPPAGEVITGPRLEAGDLSLGATEDTGQGLGIVLVGALATAPLGHISRRLRFTSFR